MKRVSLLCMLLASLFMVVAANARPAAELNPKAEGGRFYEGKTIRIIVGFSPGGFFDLWSRLLARHMKKHIPGNPHIIVQNMPGAGSMIAANHIYQVAKPDGLTLGTVIGSIYLMQIAKAPVVLFNWPQFTFIGRATGDASVFYMRADLPYRNWRDVRAAAEPIPVGATAPGSSSHLIPQVMKNVLGFNLRIIPGYRGGADITAAIERGEVPADNRAISVYVGREPFPTWHKKGFVRAIAQTGKERNPRLDLDVSTVWEIAEELRVPKADLEVMETAFAWGEWYFPFIASPGLPAERAKILREAFHRALNDPQLLEEGARMGLVPDPIDPEKLQRRAAEVMDVDLKTVERIKVLMGY